MRISNVPCLMRHLAARFVRVGDADSVSLASTDFMADPNLDLRERFHDIPKLEENINARGLHLNVQKIAKDYAEWWKCFEAKILNENKLLRSKLRLELFDCSDGLLNALSLPNELLPPLQEDNHAFSSMNSAENMGMTELEEDNKPAMVMMLMERYLDKFLSSAVDPSPVRLSPHYMVRPALVEACNMNCEDFPATIGGVGSLKLSVVGVSLPSMVACFLHQRFSDTKSRKWPLVLFSSGAKYLRTSNEAFGQKQVYSMLCFSSVEEFASKTIIDSVQKLIASLFHQRKMGLEWTPVAPPELQLFEGSACWVVATLNSGQKTKLVRISQLGDYVSKRINCRYEVKKNSEFVQMMFVEFDLERIVDCFLCK